MGSNIWNPWHGCHKYSEGCENCYMFYQDKEREKDGSVIYKVVTNFNLPLKKDKERCICPGLYNQRLFS